jgi:hypothetical protein
LEDALLCSPTALATSVLCRYAKILVLASMFPYNRLVIELVLQNEPI